MMSLGRLAELRPILENASFAKEVKKLKTLREVQDAFARHGYYVTIKELKDLSLIMVHDMDEGEFDEDALDHVSGGVTMPAWVRLFLKNMKTDGLPVWARGLLKK